jgi:hypothetical protein
VLRESHTISSRTQQHHYFTITALFVLILSFTFLDTTMGAWRACPHVDIRLDHE